MRKILRHMKEYRKESVCAPLFKLLEALFELFVPLVMARRTAIAGTSCGCAWSWQRSV